MYEKGEHKTLMKLTPNKKFTLGSVAKCKWKNIYRVCHRFRLTKQDDYFWVDFDHFLIEQYFWRQLGLY